MTAKQKDHLMEFDKKVLDHTLHDWMDAVRNAVHDIRPGMYIIAGVERHRQPILDATLEMLEVAGPVNPNVIPKPKRPSHLPSIGLS
jgi:DNA-binding ferritin-like protein (Dps family)